MNEIVLELAALLLALFCLIYSVTIRRELYVPLPKGVIPALKNQHFLFLALLGSVVLSAAASAGGTLAQSLGEGTEALPILRMLYYLLHNLPSFFFALYILNLTGPARKQRPWFFFLFFLPLLLGELLVLTNPLTRLCFFMDEKQVIQPGAGQWFLFSVSGFYIAVGLLYFIRYSGGLSRADRVGALILMAVFVVGELIQTILSVRVELFFEAVAYFGLMALLEHDKDASESNMSRRFRRSAIVALALTFLAVIVTNISLIMSQANTQIEKTGEIRLEVIRNDLEDTISEAENNVLRVAMGAEKLLDPASPRESVGPFVEAEREAFLSNESFMNLYIAGRDWNYIPNFDAPADFHASERIWYLGAAEHPGDVFISEPYIDFDTGSMCFTVSTLLSDGETVVGLDLNFSKAQESIMRMTEGTGQTAMIVTSGGLITGYTDMSLVGQRADEKLPEYADVLRRVTSSQEHGSFLTRLDGRKCMIFSSETKNNWFLILRADTSALYAQSYRQMAVMAAINLLMLVVMVVFYLVSSRNRFTTAEALTKNRHFIDDLAVRLRRSVTQILLLSDWQYIQESKNPAETVEQIKETGQRLSELTDSINAYSVLMREHLEKTEKENAKKSASSAKAPSRKARNGMILTLLVVMVIVLIFCFASTSQIGDTRLNRAADNYENQLDEWIAEQKSFLSLITDLIAARPELMADYDSAVGLLNDIAVRYPDVSACYMANPYAEHPVIMNTGWEPGEDYRPETRPWYRTAERSADHFSISAPYLDAQTGNYCVTLSQVIFGEKGEFLGIFGIDFFLDKLVNVLGESYTSDGYAFLVDSDGVIVNHPNSAYQMGDHLSVSVEDTEYAEAYNRKGITLLRDYTGHFVSCLSRRTASGFTVLVANRWWSLYGVVVLMMLIVVALFSICVILIVLLINRLIRWQQMANQQLVEAADAAVKAGKAKSQFLAQMSHEIRTPMNAIIGLDNIALRDPEISGQTREKLEKIGASARHLLSLINDILDMSRIESGRMALKEDEFSFRNFLEQISVIINGQCQDKGLRFVCETIGQTDAWFVGDDLKLKQVLINILGNSVKFTDAPGTVTFTVEQTAGDGENCVLRFVMKDTGVGMDKEFLPKLFEAFSQEDATSTNRYGGSGLGMAITKNIVDMMGGEIHVESEKGLGSIFTVTVPLKRGHQEEAQAIQEKEQPKAEVSLAGLHVLIAEDQPLNADILKDLLEMEDISCEWAENGQLAVEMFARSPENHFAAVLMDMRMPVMDGLTATKELRKLERPDAKRVPVIALTANAFEEDVRQCLQAGMNAHLSKPVDIELLKATLGQLIGGNKSGGAA